jgi:hypothetical protein
MAETRLSGLVAKLERGQRKTTETFGRLTPAQWEQVIYDEPAPWTPRSLVAHFLSSEKELLRLCQDVASGGPGAPEGYDYHGFNAEQQTHYAFVPPAQLLEQLVAARGRTLEWLGTIAESVLDRVGRHPALGEVSLEVMIVAIYGHQLLHMRDLQSKLGPA